MSRVSDLAGLCLQALKRLPGTTSSHGPSLAPARPPPAVTFAASPDKAALSGAGQPAPAIEESAENQELNTQPGSTRGLSAHLKTLLSSVTQASKTGAAAPQVLLLMRLSCLLLSGLQAEL